MHHKLKRNRLKIVGSSIGVVVFVIGIILLRNCGVILPALFTPTPTRTSTSTPFRISTPTLTPTGTLMPSPTGTPKRTPFGITPTPAPFYETTSSDISETDTLGELNVEYPIKMSPESSDTVILSIYIPDFLVNLEPLNVERIQIPNDISVIIGGLNYHRTTILVAETMRAELSSPSFGVESLYPSQQNVYINETDTPTSWAWTIRAPKTLGRQVFTLKIYLKQDVNPAWVGIFHVEVLEPSPTPKPTEPPTLIPTATPTFTATTVPSPTPTSTATPTSTPTPTSTATPTPTPTPTPMPICSRIADQLIENSAAVLGAILVFIAAIAGIFGQRKYSKTKDKIEKLQDEISKISKEREKEREDLNREN